MNSKMKIRDTMSAQLISSPQILCQMLMGSTWDWEHWRNGKIIDRWSEQNLMVDEGITSVMDVALSGGTQITAWYVVCFEDNHTPGASDTYATPGYTETTAYDEATRPAWTEAGVSAKVITNSASKASFTFNATKTIYGSALVGGGSAPTTKGNTAGGGTLMCESQFTGGSKLVESTDVLKVTVTITGSNV